MNDVVVYIVDDDDAVRSGIALLLRSAGIAARGYARADDFIGAYDPAVCGCLLLDVRLPGTSGLELQELLRERGIHLPVIMITGHADVPMAVRAMKHGAVDFLQKPFNEQILLERVQQALTQDRQRRAQEQDVRALQQRYAELSPREREVMLNIVTGKANKVIAIDLGISERTVEVHRRRVMEKMQAHSVAALVQTAVSLGLR